MINVELCTVKIMCIFQYSVQKKKGWIQNGEFG